MDKLTPKQKLFIQEYLVDLNGTQAAIRAGYSLADKSAGTEFYVYLLVDPTNGNIFYVGKGKGNRMKAHLAKAQCSRDLNQCKQAKIRSIRSAGAEPICYVFEDSLGEVQAFALERQLITCLREHGLTNISGGQVSSAESMLERVNRLNDSIPSAYAIDHFASSYTKDLIHKCFGSSEDFVSFMLTALDDLRLHYSALVNNQKKPIGDSHA